MGVRFALPYRAYYHHFDKPRISGLEYPVMTEQDARKVLAKIVREQGSQLDAAAMLGISAQYVNDLLHGRRRFSTTVLEKLGLRWTIVSVR